MRDSVEQWSAFRPLLILLLFSMAAWLGYAVVELYSSPPGLAVLVDSNLRASGVSNPVTAVLINFRGYDTLLEMGVLLLALLGVRTLGSISEYPESYPGPVLDTLSRLLVPLMILIAGYLLWVGAHAPGGAFQAGSVLGAAGVLLLLSGWHLDKRFTGLPLSMALLAGIGIFTLVGVGLLLTGRTFLEYPPSLAGALILLIEAAATVSIGITLAALFMHGRSAMGRDK